MRRINKKELKLYFANNINVPNVLVIILFLLLVVTFVILFFSENLSSQNKKFADVSNIISIVSLLFSILAGLIALLAYKYSIRKPNLNVRVGQYLGKDKEFKMPVVRDKNGHLVISICRPLTEMFITIENNGNSSARYPVIFIEFDNMFFGKGAFPGWDEVLHAHGLGYHGYKWSPEDSIIYSGIPIKAPTLYFAGKSAPLAFRKENKEETFTHIKIKFTADKTGVKEFIIQIRLYLNDY